MRIIWQTLKNNKLFAKYKVPKQDHHQVFLEFQQSVISLSKTPQPFVRIRSIKTH